MDLLLSGVWPDLQETVAGAARSAGFELAPVDGHESLYRLKALVPGRDCGHAECGWLAVEQRDDGTRLAVWLPVSGDGILRERLENAMDGLVVRKDPADVKAVLRRLRRIEGQIRGLQRMIETGRECEEVMTQLSAASVALKQTAARIVSEHFAQCVRDALESGDDVEAVNQRLLNILF